MTEPTCFPSVPGPYVYLLTGANDPDRDPAPQGSVGTLDGDLQLAGRTDPLQVLRRPSARHGVKSPSLDVHRKSCWACRPVTSQVRYCRTGWRGNQKTSAEGEWESRHQSTTPAASNRPPVGPSSGSVASLIATLRLPEECWVPGSR